MTSVVDSLYHSGVGWFNDILEAEIFIDSEVETHSSVPRFTRVNPIAPEERKRLVHPPSSTKNAFRPTGASKAAAAASRRAARQLDEEGRGSDDDEEDSAEEEYYDSNEDSDDDEAGMTVEDLAKRSDGKFSTNWIPLVSSGVPISGFIRIVAPPGRAIPYNGIKASLESSLFALEELATRDLYSEEILIAGGGELHGTTDLPFAFLNPANHPLPEAYEGDLFSIRHKVSVIIERPWYTFNVSNEAPLAVQTVHHLPRDVTAAADAIQRSKSVGKRGAGKTENNNDDGDNDADDRDGGAAKGAGGRSISVQSPKSPSLGGVGSPSAAAAAAAAALAAAEAATDAALAPTRPLPAELARDGSIFGAQTMSLDGLEPGSSITLEFDRGCYEINETIHGSIACKGLTKNAPILLLKLAVVRIEYADGEAADSVIFDDAIMDARRWKARKDRRLAIERFKQLALEQEEARLAAIQAAEAAAEAAANAPEGDGATETESSSSSSSSSSSNAAAFTVDVVGGSASDGTTTTTTSSSSGSDKAGTEGGDLASTAPSDSQEQSQQPAAETETEPEAVNPLLEWIPENEEYESENPDPDLPILGDVNLTVDLALAALKVTPTYVIDVNEDDESKKPTTPKPATNENKQQQQQQQQQQKKIKSKKAVEDDDDEDANRATVRYFIRLTAYTDLTADARRWNAHEIVLYRGQLYGQEIPEFRLPRNIAGYGGDEEQAQQQANAELEQQQQQQQAMDEAANNNNNVRIGGRRDQTTPLGIMLPAPLSGGLRMFGITTSGDATTDATATSSKRFDRLAPGNALSSSSGGTAALAGITVAHHGGYNTTTTTSSSSSGSSAEVTHGGDLASFLTRSVVVNPMGTKNYAPSSTESSSISNNNPPISAPTLSEQDADTLLRGRRL